MTILFRVTRLCVIELASSQCFRMDVRGSCKSRIQCSYSTFLLKNYFLNLSSMTLRKNENNRKFLRQELNQIPSAVTHSWLLYEFSQSSGCEFYFSIYCYSVVKQRLTRYFIPFLHNGISSRCQQNPLSFHSLAINSSVSSICTSVLKLLVHNNTVQT